jgi:hypothetical protein
MSEQPTPQLRAAAERLFEAARAERPQAALGRRLDLLTPTQETPQRSTLLGAALCSRMGRRGVSALALCATAAALIMGTAGLVRTLGRGEPIRISAEQGAVPRAVSPVPPPEELASPETERAASEAAPRAAKEPSAGAPRPAAAQRSHALDRRRSTGTSSVPPHASAAALPAPAVEDSHRDAPAATPSAPRPPSLRAELEWLENARAELRAGHAQRALDLLERPGSDRTETGLDAEATVLRIEALSALGRDPEASELAAHFVQDHPTSALGDRARSFIRSAPRPAE